MHNGSLSLSWTPFSAAIGFAALITVVALGVAAWRRSGFAFGVGLLEALRCSIVALVVVTLGQPEWLEHYLPDTKPTIAILVDASGSMETKDVVSQSGPAAEPRRRSEVIRSLLEREHWTKLSDRFEIVRESFSAPADQSETGTDINAALADAFAGNPNLRGVVLLSDGDWNVGEAPVRAAVRLKMQGVPVFAVGVGSETRLPDIELTRLDAPTFGIAGKPMRIPFLLESAMPRSLDVTVTLAPSLGKPISKTVTLPAMGRVEQSIVWKPEQVGELNLTMSVPVSAGELVAENNTRAAPISIREEAIKVLLIESTPRWEYRYLRNALLRDPGVEVHCVLFHPGLGKLGGGQGYLKAVPGSKEELAKYDVLLLGDVGVEPDQLTREQCRLIKGLVQSQASGLILMPGISGRQLSLLETELEELFPVVLDSAQPRGWGSRGAANMELTQTGRMSLLTKLEDSEDENARVWETLPGFQWYAGVLRARAGAEVLAIHKTDTNRFGRIPLLATKTFGTGKILFMGTDGAWRWREGVEDKYHYRFWGQVARWMAYQRTMAQGERMRLFYSPDRPQAGVTTMLNANVMSRTGNPLATGEVAVHVTAPSGKTQVIRLTPGGEEWGLFSGFFVPQEPGDHRLLLTCKENESTLETKLAVQHENREKLGRPARYDVLDEIAAVTGGKRIAADNLEQLFERIAEIPEPEPLVKRLRLWCHPLWAGAIVLFLAAFWTGRKIIGTI